MDSVLAGAFAGGVTTAAMHPFDVAKIRLQLRRNSSFSQALGELWRSPVKEAYRGLTPNLIGNAAAWGAYFGNYELLQGIVFGEPFNVRPSSTSYLLCSFTAGISCQAMTNPIWVLKTRILGTRRSDPGSSASVWKTAKQVYAHGGIAGFWRGFLPGTLGTVQSAMYFSIYGPLKPWLKTKYELPDTATYFVASTIAKSVAATVMYPHQVVRARMQFSEVGMLQAIEETWIREGWHGFYRGLSVNLARVVPAMAITLVTYELTKKRLSAPPPNNVLR